MGAGGYLVELEGLKDDSFSCVIHDFSQLGIELINRTISQNRDLYKKPCIGKIGAIGYLNLHLNSILTNAN
jgi:hypothetical protein